MASKFINPFTSSKKEDDLDVIALAEKAGIKAPSQKKSNLQKVVDILNTPSRKTEEFLTGKQGYSKVLEQAGVRDIKGKLDYNDALTLAGQLVLDPLNLVGFAGLGAKALKGAGAVGKVATKIGPVAKTADAVGDLFVPGHKLSKVSPDLAKTLPSLEKFIAAKQGQQVRKTAELGRQYSPDAIKNLGKLVEKAGVGGKLTDEELSAVGKTTKFIEETITAPEKAAGISPNQLLNYFPRKADR